MDIHGGHYSLYMVNGVGQYKDDLLFGQNSGGIGDLSEESRTGAHKMAEAAFDAANFTEVLAVVRGQNDGNWLSSRKVDGSAFTAAEVFALGATRAEMIMTWVIREAPDLCAPSLLPRGS